jgi:hypothetical protein
VNAADVVLSYEENRWRARGAGVDVAHVELRSLEALLEAQLAAEHCAMRVQICFDMAALPRWLHQYHGHYCNYVLHVPARSASS